MTALETALRPDLTPQVSRGELVHEQCCTDPDTAMCGTPIAGRPWARRADCIVCMALLAQWAEAATVQGPVDSTRPCRFCPKREVNR